MDHSVIDPTISEKSVIDLLIQGENLLPVLQFKPYQHHLSPISTKISENRFFSAHLSWWMVNREANPCPVGYFFAPMRYQLNIFFRFGTKSVLFSGAQCVSNSILGLNHAIPNHYRCHSHWKRRKPEQNRQSIHKNPCLKADKLSKYLLPYWLLAMTMRLTCKTNKLIRFNAQMKENLQCL